MGELIYQKDFDYAMPHAIENVVRISENKRLEPYTFTESIEYYPDLLGNYTLGMIREAQVQEDSILSAEESIFNATLVFVDDNVIVDFRSTGEVFHLGCEMDWNEDNTEEWRDNRRRQRRLEHAEENLPDDD